MSNISSEALVGFNPKVSGRNKVNEIPNISSPMPIQIGSQAERSIKNDAREGAAIWANRPPAPPARNTIDLEQSQ